MSYIEKHNWLELEIFQDLHFCVFAAMSPRAPLIGQLADRNVTMSVLPANFSFSQLEAEKEAISSLII
jgi:hypothetical protein